MAWYRHSDNGPFSEPILSAYGATKPQWANIDIYSYVRVKFTFYDFKNI